MPVASPSGDRCLKSLPRARGRASAGCRWYPRQGTASAVDEVLKPHYFSECDLKCTMRLRTQNKNHTISKPLFQASPKQCLDFEKLCTYFAAFLFAHSSSKTGTKLNLARLFARWHLIRLASSATSPHGEGSSTCRTTSTKLFPREKAPAHRIPRLLNFRHSKDSPGRVLFPSRAVFSWIYATLFYFCFSCENQKRIFARCAYSGSSVFLLLTAS